MKVFFLQLFLKKILLLYVNIISYLNKINLNSNTHVIIPKKNNDFC